MRLDPGTVLFLSFALWVIGMFVLYWVIRQAVAGAITDVEARRAREEAERRRRAAEQDRPKDDDQQDDDDENGDGDGDGDGR